MPLRGALGESTSDCGTLSSRSGCAVIVSDDSWVRRLVSAQDGRQIIDEVNTFDGSSAARAYGCGAECVVERLDAGTRGVPES